MQVIIIGCGRVGETLARALVGAGEDVVVLDRRAEQLARISDLDCLRVEGMVIDQKSMEQSGMANADWVFCVTDDENLNLMAGQIARSFFQVPQVVVRVYSPSHIDVFEEEGFHLVSSTEIFVAELLRSFSEPIAANRFALGEHALAVSRLPVAAEWDGMCVADLETELEGHILGIERKGRLILARSRSPLEAGDALLIVEQEEEA